MSAKFKFYLIRSLSIFFVVFGISALILPFYVLIYQLFDQEINSQINTKFNYYISYIYNYTGISIILFSIYILWGIRLFYNNYIKLYFLQIISFALLFLLVSVIISMLNDSYHYNGMLGNVIASIFRNLNIQDSVILLYSILLMIPLLIASIGVEYILLLRNVFRSIKLDYIKNRILPLNLLNKKLIDAVTRQYNVVLFNNSNKNIINKDSVLSSVNNDFPELKQKNKESQCSNFKKELSTEDAININLPKIETNIISNPSCKEASNNSCKVNSNIEMRSVIQSGHDEGAVDVIPSIDLLQDKVQNDSTVDLRSIDHNRALLAQVLQDFKIRGEIINVNPGPVVTLFELAPEAGTKSSRIIGLSDDIARSMSAVSARISVISGRNAIGIEIPNKKRSSVFLREIMETDEYNNINIALPLALGKLIDGTPIIADLAKMPHLLIAGTTGSGKSVAINSMILSLIYRLPPNKCKFIMIDPKMLELSIYNDIPHLLTPVVVDPKKAVNTLKWVVQEMENRYKLMSHLNVRGLSGYNQKIKSCIKENKMITRKVQMGFDKESGERLYKTEDVEMQELPLMVVIVDEMADLMLVAGKDIEIYIQRLAQMARAAGIHIIMATQRPSVDVITGVIKANFPTRIAFSVSSKIDSRTILGEQGAEQLLGMGDMLYMSSGGKITRIHGPFVSDSEVENIVNDLKMKAAPRYIPEIENFGNNEEGNNNMINVNEVEGATDDIYAQAINIVLRDKKTSISYIQRQLRIGYNRAADLIERMEREFIISEPNHQGRREILKHDD